jgi:hypothetical protein
VESYATSDGHAVPASEEPLSLPAIDRQTWLRVTLLALIVLIVSSVPYGVGYLASTPEWQFGGIVVDREDSESHLAKMQQGARGSWRYRLLFTPEDHPGAYINTFYVGLGHLSRLSGLSLAATYQLTRLVCGFILLLTLYVFLRTFLRRKYHAWLAYVLAATSSGLGWAVLLLSGSFTLGQFSPIDFWLMDAYVFFSVLAFPHSTLAVALLLITFLAVLICWERSSWRALLVACLSFLALCVVHPFNLLLVAVILGLFWALRSWRRRAFQAREAAALAVLMAVPLPLVLYIFVALDSNPVFRSWSAQNITVSDSPIYYLLGYGLVALLALPGAVRAVRRGEEHGLFPVVWVGAAALLLYAPFKMQRRMIEGFQAPLAVLATQGLVGWLMPLVGCSRLARRAARWGYPRRRLSRLLALLVLALAALSNVYLLASLSLAAASRDESMFYRRAEVRAVEWLAANSADADTVLSSYIIGGYIPAHIGHRVFWGHWCETADRPGKGLEVRAFFSASTPDEQRRDILRRYGVAYVFYGPREKALGDFDPATAPYLERTFNEGEVSLFRVVGLR